MPSTFRLTLYLMLHLLLPILAQQQAAVGTSTRPSWQAGVSVCESLPGFQTADLYPIRSPLAVADFLSEQVKGRAFCEIGTRNGDVMGCVAHFAKSVTAIEMDPPYCRSLRERGFGVACKQVEQILPDAFPKADIYYWWPSDAGGQNELWLRIIAMNLRMSGQHQASVYIGFDSHWFADMNVLPDLVDKYNGTVTRLFFDEGGAVRGPAHASPTYARAKHKLEASIKKPFFSRPGHWGVFHLARFEIGPEMWRRMLALPFYHPEYAAARQRARSAMGGGGAHQRRGSNRGNSNMVETAVGR